MVTLAVAMFLLGWVGATLACLGFVWFFCSPAKWKLPASTQNGSNVPNWLDRLRAPKPEPPKDYPVAPIKRTVGSWRHQKAELERHHNSKQKERDQRVAGL